MPSSPISVTAVQFSVCQVSGKACPLGGFQLPVYVYLTETVDQQVFLKQPATHELFREECKILVQMEK